MPNRKMVNLHIAEYKSIITELRTEIENLKEKLNTNFGIPSACSCGRAEEDLECRQL